MLSSVNSCILIFFSETTGPIKTKIGRNVHWMFFCKEYVFLYHEQKSTTIWPFESLVLRDPKVELRPYYYWVNPIHDEVYSIQHCVIKFVSDLWKVSGFSPGTPVSSTNKTDPHDITEILLKVALSTMTLTHKPTWYRNSMTVINY